MMEKGLKLGQAVVISILLVFKVYGQYDVGQLGGGDFEKTLQKQLDAIEAINRTTAEKDCDKIEYCDVSDARELVCGSDMKQYTNPGVLWCARFCNPSK